MMRRIHLLISVLMTMAVSAIAAANNVTDANIGGHVIDGENGDHMPGCLVKIIDTGMATMTDASGHYIFRDLKPGEYIVEVSMMGYATERKSATVSLHETMELNFNILPDAFMLDQVVVTSSKSELRRRESPSLVNVVSAKTFFNV